MNQPLDIAVIGSGIAGMTAAALLHQRHRITLFEANDYLGGHTNTVSVEHGGEQHAIDTGFIVFNERTYPNFCKLLSELEVESKPTEMSFSVRDTTAGLEYCGSTLNGLFAERRNLIRPSFHRMLRDIVRFNRQAPELLESLEPDATVGEFLLRYRYSREFSHHYLLPMGAAIWSCPTATFEKFPIRFIIEFYSNHGLLQLRDRPIWRTICGGSEQYVQRLTGPYRQHVRLNCPVQSVERLQDRVRITSVAGVEQYDEVVIACHSDQALRLLADQDEFETSLLQEFPYSRNRAVLHTDTSLLPRRRRAWASWNYHVSDSHPDQPTLTYCMNILQRLESRHTYCVTLNEVDSIDADRILGSYNYSHPIFTARRASAQARHTELIRRRRTSFCGAYWGNGFHEDGVNSALAVCARFGIARDRWSLTPSGRSSQQTTDTPLQPEPVHVS